MQYIEIFFKLINKEYQWVLFIQFTQNLLPSSFLIIIFFAGLTKNRQP